ncbi:tyrosine-type recombinase/integrase [Microbispora siamensis]
MTAKIGRAWLAVPSGGHGDDEHAAETAAPDGGVAEGIALHECFPAREVSASWQRTCVDRERLLRRLLVPPFALEHPGSQVQRRLGLVAVVNWLQDQPGETWQERWLASGAESERDWRNLPARWRGVLPAAAGERDRSLARLGVGLLQLTCADVIRPSLAWLLATSPRIRGRNLAAEMARTRGDTAAFTTLAELSRQGNAGPQRSNTALARIAVIMAAKGGQVAEITVGDCVEVLRIAATVCDPRDGHAHSPFFYQLLRGLGVFPDHAPTVLRVLRSRGQRTCEELIDRYRLQCRPIRDLLVDYLRERQLSTDFASLDRLAWMLGKLFWSDLEAHLPGIDSLRLPREVAAAWKQRVMTKTITTRAPDGQTTQATTTRLDGRNILAVVRAFYLDLAEWAEDDPARWGPWVTRCPISVAEVSQKKERTQRKSRTDQRTRERLPVLPLVVAHVERERTAAAERLNLARATPPGQTFTLDGMIWRRPVMKAGSAAKVWAEDPQTGARRDLTHEEHRAFWAWATVEVLRHTGIRLEELTELSHHSLIQYRLPSTGELVPLLQIAPSKTDAERLLVISPELADVLSVIMCRIRQPTGAVPLVTSYDRHERRYNPPMPLLFQWRVRLEDRPLSVTPLRTFLNHALQACALSDASGRPLRFTFHDFRRIFVTDAVMHGMPPHIAQLVAGHRDINTTMGYKAVYPEEVINGHRAFITRRRALRPSQEYRTPTDEEWEEFLGHFQRRKLSLGTCGRSYDTPCIHEHACIRCPLLRPDPAQRPRLADICANLTDRIAEAERHGWTGEVDGLKVSLTAAQHKLAQMDEIATRRNSTLLSLGMPSFPSIAGRTITGEPA